MRPTGTRADACQVLRWRAALTVARSKSVAPEIRGNGRAASAVGPPNAVCRSIMELEATPGIEPGYTVLQTVA